MRSAQCRAAYKITIDDEYTSPSMVAGSSRAVTPDSPRAVTAAIRRGAPTADEETRG